MEACDRRAFLKIAARARVECVHAYAVFAIGALTWIDGVALAPPGRASVSVPL